MRRGFIPFAEWIGDENNMEENMREGRQYPNGPSFVLRGKQPLVSIVAVNMGALLESFLQKFFATSMRDNPWNASLD